MAGVDRLLKNLPYGEPPPSVGSAPTVRNTPAVAPPGADLTAAGQWLGTWARVVLGLLIGIGMTQWPYTHGCGPRLISISSALPRGSRRGAGAGTLPRNARAASRPRCV